MHYSKVSSKTQNSNENTHSNELYFILILVIITLATFITLTPKISSSLFPQKREMILNTFISKTQQTRNLDERNFWEFREFYSPGYFDFNKNGLNSEKVAEAEKKMKITFSEKATRSAHLHFNSKLVESIDYLTQTGQLSDIVDFPSDKVIFQNNESIIYENADETLIVIFVKPLDEMRRANGYFEYEGKDKELVQDKYWLNITKINRK